jgi:hypothetical protein
MCADEWETYKVAVLAQTDTFNITIAHASCSCRYPEFSKVGRIIACFGASNAEVERGFILSKRIKTKLRNRLKVATVDRLMRLRLNAGPYNTFPYYKAFQAWLRGAKRMRYRLRCVDAKGQLLQPREPEVVEIVELNLDGETLDDVYGIPVYSIDQGQFDGFYDYVTDAQVVAGTEEDLVGDIWDSELEAILEASIAM